MKSLTRPTFNIFTLLALLTSLFGSAVTVTPVSAAAPPIDISGPSGSGQFGASVTTLPNGNFVVTDPFFDAPGPVTDVGAVYLYNGATHTLISALTGSTANDAVGSGGVIVLTNSSNFIIRSPDWDGMAVNVGAVTFGNGATGVTGTVSAVNSLVGSTASDTVGSSDVFALTNGNYVVASPNWDGAAADVGAVTWGSGISGIVGVVSAANSLVGSTLNDYIGIGGVTGLTNGNYVIGSYFWDGAASNVGAATWGNGTGGTVGAVSASNSLVGSTVDDFVAGTITPLTNGNYVVKSPSWSGAAVNVGAATWGNGMGGTVGSVSSANSLVGSATDDKVGIRVTALTNGNYVVRSYNWDGAAIDVGAVTWGSGTGGLVGAVSAFNSLVGSAALDKVGNAGVIALINGNYVVTSPNWDGAATDVGAATWANGVGGLVGAVSAANSLVGSTLNDNVGFNITALTNGNYVVVSPDWDGAAMNVGAATWGGGTGGLVGPVSAANSLVGSTASDNIGNGGVTALANGNYVVASYLWDGAAADVGAATWGNGTSGLVGAVSAANSLVGSATASNVGFTVTALTDGNYVVGSPYWEDTVTDVGAATWADGTSGLIGVVSAANSLVGSTASDYVGYAITALTNGNYVVKSGFWDNGATIDSGAITLIAPGTPIVGSVAVANSVLGIAAAGGAGLNFEYDDVNFQLVIGRPFDNIVTLFSGGVGGLVVLSSLRVNANPTAVASVDFTVTFPESVTGVDISDFMLTTSRVSGATISGVGGSGSIYTVSVNTGSGNGSIRLDVVDDDTIINAALNPLGGVGLGNGKFIKGEAYTVIKEVTFNDVSLTYWANSFIERLYNAGITGGCSTTPLNYCPDASVTRAQMAIFILRGIHGSTYTPPLASGTIFSDVPLNSFAADWIEQLAAEGVTAGCGGGNYCPDATVTRAQMAIFLLRGEHGSVFIPLAATGAVFSDVPLGSFADAWIEQLFSEGVTGGCGNGNYCPNNSVTRAEMAVFLVRTFNLP